ncbi:hypothetical protein KBY83_12660 [Cyanobium sp. WKJ7-Wakatipu]|uniref:hypothetical protein n=1 Tax=Cyanobium sp. WKJ7-Wakatipu TaxID=2823726 RepID=UPI0020CC4F59|nr:hypothetical protein [Cyanobium sp. WKJ7-Wakatipu]MCP9784152.1 hypothetical protein [Cyanobium sp. WKJ7-Wakatipu]
MTFAELPRMGSGRVSEARRQHFHAQVQEVVVWMRQYVRRLGFAPVARSWLYALESEGKITKGDFTWASKWLADRRKEGLIPFELVGADTTRQLTGHDNFDEEATPREYINRQLRDSLEQAAMYWPSSYWKHQTNYPILWSEKKDVLKLFKPELPDAIRRFAGKGQADVNSRLAVVQECQWAQENDLQPVILYVGDHDPSGIKISDGIAGNLRQIAKVEDWECGLDEMESDGRIVRFGLNADFINNARLLWIDGLETARDEAKGTNDLANPRHPDHGKDYVQSYLLEFGPRKCESNALIANPTAARALIRDELWRWLSYAGHKQWEAENHDASKEAAAAAEGIKRMLAMFDSAGVLYNPGLIQSLAQASLPGLPA